MLAIVLLFPVCLFNVYDLNLHEWSKVPASKIIQQLDYQVWGAVSKAGLFCCLNLTPENMFQLGCLYIGVMSDIVWV